MKKTLIIILAMYTFTFSFNSQDLSGAVAVFSTSKIYIEPLDAALAMLGSLHVDKILRKRSLGHQPKDN